MDILDAYLVGAVVAGLASIGFYYICVGIGKLIDLIIGGIGK